MLTLAIEDSLVDIHMVVHRRLHIEVLQQSIVCLAWRDSDEIEVVNIDKLDPWTFLYFRHNICYILFNFLSPKIS